VESVRILTTMVKDVIKCPEDHLHLKSQIQDYQNKDRLSIYLHICKILLLQRRPKLGRRKSSNGAHAARGLDIAGLDSHVRCHYWALAQKYVLYLSSVQDPQRMTGLVVALSL